ncbi:MAG: flagellar biosynthesis protein FlhF [Gammaproteobacteria bacterium]|nr:flagellar biosynthesis protein FlhF [Gammaproteobacteria bacterium]
MRIKRFFAADMRQAIRLVRTEQGPEAVILSSRAVNGGIEIISAMDYDQRLVSEMVYTAEKNRPSQEVEPVTKITEHSDRKVQGRLEEHAVSEQLTTPPPVAVKPQVLPASTEVGRPLVLDLKTQDPALKALQQDLAAMKGLLREQLSGLAWGDYSRNQPVRAQHVKRLKRLGFSPSLSRELADAVQEINDPVKSWREVLYRVAKKIPTSQGGIIEQGGTIALVGPTGVGKTTTLAKLAALFALRHGRDQVAMVNVDTFRIGAQKQLQTYGQILSVPVITTRLDELGMVLDGLTDKKLILIDTAGFGPRDPRNKKRFQLYSKISSITTYLTIASNIQRNALDEVVRTFGTMGLKGCILTKLDEAANLGDALSVIIRHGLPLVYVSDGQRVPEDLHPARVNNLLTRAVSLAKKFNENVDEGSPVWPMHLRKTQEVGISV